MYLKNSKKKVKNVKIKWHSDTYFVEKKMNPKQNRIKMTVFRKPELTY